MNSWRDSYYVWFPLYTAARLERTDVHHIADTSPCCVLQLQQKQRGNLLIRTESTVTTGGGDAASGQRRARLADIMGPLARSGPA